jgi:hypothetical protein
MLEYEKPVGKTILSKGLEGLFHNDCHLAATSYAKIL